MRNDGGLKMKTVIGLLFGCPSVEHEVAIISALQAMQSLNKDKYDPIPIYISIWETL